MKEFQIMIIGLCVVFITATLFAIIRQSIKIFLKKK